MNDNIVYLQDYKQDKLLTANVVGAMLTSILSEYNSVLSKYGVDTQDKDIAFDIATIQFLLHGMAHRSQGESHPSQIILNSMRQNMLGS